MTHNERLMTSAEVAEMLQIPLATLHTWRAHRTGLRGYRVGRHVRYRRVDIESWLEQRADRIHGEGREV